MADLPKNRNVTACADEHEEAVKGHHASLPGYSRADRDDSQDNGGEGDKPSVGGRSHRSISVDIGSQGSQTESKPDRSPRQAGEYPISQSMKQFVHDDADSKCRNQDMQLPEMKCRIP